MGGEICDEQSRKQAFVAIQFGRGDEPVMMPVDDLAVLQDESRKQDLIDSAWAFYQRGQFARDSLNSEFIEALAGDFAESLPLPDILARFVVTGIGKVCLERLEKEATERGEDIVDANALHLKVERTGAGAMTIVLDPPAGWEEKALERVSDLTRNLLAHGTGLMLWVGFTKWIWVNQVARALGDLEEDLGEDTLAAMPGPEFDALLVARMVESEDSASQFGELIYRYVEMLAEIAVEAIARPAHELWMLELFLGFRDHAPDGKGRKRSSIVCVDFGSLLQVVTQRPEDLYKLPSRRFEELVAHIFERFGYKVELTPETRDGGFDISAVRKAETDIRLLIECKRYTPPNKVGRPIVQQVFGVLADRNLQATKAIVATTSTFTSDARAYIDSNRWKLEGRDLTGVLKWIELLRNRP